MPELKGYQKRTGQARPDERGIPFTSHINGNFPFSLFFYAGINGIPIN